MFEFAHLISLALAPCQHFYGGHCSILLSCAPFEQTQTGLFHVPFGRVNSVQRCFIKRLPQLANSFMSVCPDVDFFGTCSSFMSQMQLFSKSQGAYI